MSEDIERRPGIAKLVGPAALVALGASGGVGAGSIFSPETLKEHGALGLLAMVVLGAGWFGAGFLGRIEKRWFRSMDKLDASLEQILLAHERHETQDTARHAALHAALEEAAKETRHELRNTIAAIHTNLVAEFRHGRPGSGTHGGSSG